MVSKNISRRDFIRVSAALGASLVCCEKGGKPGNPPNILWIMTDDQRVDSIGAYGSEWAKSPNIDSIAQSGVLFRNAVAQSVVCAPSRVSMVSGRYCHSNGMTANGAKVKEDTYPLTREFGDAGYQLTNIGKIHAEVPGYKTFDTMIPAPGYGGPASNPFKFKNEFEGKESEYGVIKLPDFVIISGTYPLPEEKTEHGITTSNAINFIEDSLQEPFFLRVSMISPHTPVLPPEPYDSMYNPDEIPLPLPTDEELRSKPKFEREKLMEFSGSAGRITNEEIKKARASYYGLSASVDNQVGRLLDVMRKKNLLENTIVVFSSDQGVQMGEHGIFMKRNFYEQTILSPLIVSYPGRIPQGRVVDSHVELLDIFPTMFELAGLPPVKDINGM
ncbi:sulfatase-like hydrolase/transferase, partial [bacterium]|nr:sulfatase-like hydrolase/transferase [bacterium]